MDDPVVGRIAFGPKQSMSELRRVAVQSPVDTAHAVKALRDRVGELEATNADLARREAALQAEVVRLREALEGGRVALAEWLEEQGYSDLDADEIVELVAARTALKEDA